MKKIKFIILSLLLIFPVEAYALTGKISIVCNPTTVKPGENVECLIKGNSDELVGSIESTITLKEGLSIVSFSPKNPFEGNDVAGNKIETYNSSGVKDDFDIGTLKLKVADTATDGTFSLGLVNTKFYGKDDKENTVSNASANIVVKSQEVSKGLKSLSVEGYNISPIFDPNGDSYSVIIKGDSFKINAIPANDSDKVVIYNIEDENTPLNASNIKFNPKNGLMVVIIRVGSVDYQLIIKREIEQEYDNTIKSITVGGKNIDLIAGKYDGYEVTLDDVKDYDIKIVLNDEDNFYVDNATDGIISWQGDGPIPIVIYPKDSSSGIETLTYWITVKKAEGSSTPSSSRPSSTGGTMTNPQTGNISIFVITLVLIGSLILSLNLYKKNMNYYN